MGPSPLVPTTAQTQAIEHMMKGLLEAFSQSKLFIEDQEALGSIVNHFSYDPDPDIPDYFELQQFEEIIWPLIKYSDEAQRILDSERNHRFPHRAELSEIGDFEVFNF